MPHFNVKIFLKFGIFCYLIINDKNFYSYHLNWHPFYLPNKKPILSFDKGKSKILANGRKYLDKCLNFSSRKKFKYNKKPITSVILPLFNCENNDFSIDNTLKII